MHLCTYPGCGHLHAGTKKKRHILTRNCMNEKRKHIPKMAHRQKSILTYLADVQ